ncbi:hypothetical protein BG53_08240 [Paenibacillus darwinianus]|uniref:Thiol-disulfide oxidoreductase n=1 Tax=Paenibacillus darwinianus TaxID=1380763 RepID=A0A9W5W6G1_9BACL|nr:DUF393 domain-containing protein [Paenibacillus darwinianus]EXX85538.1 hypothetical protein BG53_08240 [Paenibacillus darwinianus]EXX85563.1 hypothetical protein CH50_09235 [Paenibacillus darwinianus]EXX85692.1 hypothetical protein BG52_07950 [Paenibacillus darwinianus]
MAGAKRGPIETLYVVYDAYCILCTGTVKRLQAFKPKRAELIYVTLQSLADGGAPDIPGRDNLDQQTLYAKLHVVDRDGRLFAGADGVVRIMHVLPGFRLVAWLYRIPGMRRAADRLYRLIANRRYDWFGKTDEGCADGACRLPERSASEREDPIR